MDNKELIISKEDLQLQIQESKRIIQKSQDTIQQHIGIVSYCEHQLKLAAKQPEPTEEPKQA